MKYLKDDQEDHVSSSADEWDKKDDEIITHKTTRKSKIVKKKKKNVKVLENAKEDNKDDLESLESDQEYEGLPMAEEDTADSALDSVKNNIKQNEKQSDIKAVSSSKSKVQAEPLKFLTSDKDVVELKGVEESSDDEEIVYDSEQRMNIREAFANDDVIGDFIQEKHDLIENMKPKAVDLTLPGWGDWAGAGLTVSKKKRKRFTKEAEPAPKRKDDRMANVIISETRNKKLAQIQVGFHTHFLE